MAEEQIEEKAKTFLKTIKKGKGWTNPRGIKRVPLLSSDDAIVGNLWEDVDLKDITIGDYWETYRGIKVELLKGDEVVGMMWIE